MSDGRGGGGCGACAAGAEWSGGSSAWRKRCSGSSLGPRLAQIGACAHIQTKTHEWGKNGRNQGGGGPSSWGERAATMGGGQGAGRTGGSGVGAWVGRHLLAPQKNRLRNGAAPGKSSRRKGKSGGKQVATMLRRGVRGDRMETRCGLRRGGWAPHRHKLGGADKQNWLLQRRRDQAVPLPSRHGESNPEPCRP